MNALTSAHRRQVLGLTAVTIRDLRLLWQAFDPNDRTTWDRFALPATTLIRAQQQVAVALGSRYYTALRAKAGHGLTPNEVTLRPIELEPERVQASMTATGLAGTYGALGAGKPMAAALDNGFVRVAMAAHRMVASGSRDAVAAAVRSDAQARGWTRQAGGSPCSWCAERDGVRMTNDEVFQAHDGCSCVAEPAWS